MFPKLIIFQSNTTYENGIKYQIGHDFESVYYSIHDCDRFGLCKLKQPHVYIFLWGKKENT